ncbi:MAG: mandelate racemase/muconate lactonizing enzyme family protein [Verrucomicrobia bacterium]|nr:mandelate racemase/muconate lactonizing enzyme family protein [Verrucomicrobiota bacterium]
MSIIVQIEAWLVRVPLLQEWAVSPEFGEHAEGNDRLILCIRDSEGFEGWGESMFGGAQQLREDTLSGLVGKAISDFRLSFLDLWPTGSQYWQRPLAPSPFTPNLAYLQHRLRHPLQTLVEMALSDLKTKRAGVPLNQLFGGAWRDRILTDYWMGRVTPHQAQNCVRRAQQLGFRGVKLKTTLEDPNVERLEAIRDVAGPEWKVTVDPNGRFYNLDDAWSVIRRMDQVGNMAILEDPFPRFHLEQFAELRRRINARMVVHIDPPESLWSVLQSGAAGGINLDSHTQGLFNWRLQAAVAAQANLPVWHGSGNDLGIYTAAQLHLCASAPNCQLPGDQIGPWSRECHLLTKDFEIKDGWILLPTGPGLGVEIDHAALNRYTHKHYEWSK